MPSFGINGEKNPDLGHIIHTPAHINGPAYLDSIVSGILYRNVPKRALIELGKGKVSRLVTVLVISRDALMTVSTSLS